MAEGLGFQWRALQTRVPTVLGPPPSWSLCPRDFRPQPRGAGRGPQAHRAEAGRGLIGGVAPRHGRSLATWAWLSGAGPAGRRLAFGPRPAGREAAAGVRARAAGIGCGGRRRQAPAAPAAARRGAAQSARVVW